MQLRLMVLGLVSLLAACTGSVGANQTGNGGNGNGTGTGTAGSGTGTGGSGNVTGTAGSGTGTAGSTPIGGMLPPTPTDLCVGLVTDKMARPMTTLAKPAVGQAVTDAEFGTVIRRITAVSGGGSDPVIKPLYSTVPAWNADESRLILYQVGSGHRLYDGRTYAFIRALDISPPDLEQVFWHATDPDVFFYVDDTAFIRYHVGTSRREVVTTFSFCTEGASSGSDPMYMSFDSNRIGLQCGNQTFVYEVSSNTVVSRKTMTENPPQMSASGNLGWLGDTGRVTDAQLNILRTLDLDEPFAHAGLGRLPTGEDTWNGHVYDEGPGGNDNIGSVVTWDMAKATSKVIVGPKTGWPYPPGGHVSAVAIRQPGWVFLSVQGGGNTGRELMDMELIIANSVTGAVCRAGRHRSFGKDNTQLGQSYWAEAHNTPSPSGTRILFASDWMGGSTVDSYVVELPTYTP
jgi:hypothetical protein